MKEVLSMNYLFLTNKNISLLKAKVEEDGEALRLDYLNIFIDSQESLICKSFEIIMSCDTGVLQPERTFVLNILIYIHAKL